MLFERLRIENLGVFRGEHSLNLLPTDPSRPIVLVGALNGSGKTTFIEALQLALYGKRAGYGWRGVGAYVEYLSHLRNRHAEPSAHTTAEITLRLADGRRLRVCRQWVFGKSQPRESLAVFLNDSKEPDLALSDGWDEEVERLLPARLSELFFFDGERIEKLADPAQSADVLRAAVASLLGLDLVDHLAADIEILEVRQRQKLLSDGDKAGLEKLSSEYAQLLQRRENLFQEKSSVASKIDRARLDYDSVCRKLQNQGGDRFKQREQLVRDQATAASKCSNLHERLRLQASGALPLRLLGSQLLTLRQHCANDRSSTDPFSASAVRNHIDKFQAWVKRKKFPAKITSELIDYTSTARRALPESDEGSTQRHSQRLLTLLDTLLNSTLASAAQTTSTLIGELDTSTEQLHALEERLAAVPEQEQLATLLKAQGAGEAAVTNLTTTMSRLTQELATVDKLLIEARNERSDLLSKVSESGEAARISEYCARAAKTLSHFRATLVQHRREQLEQLILEAFQLLTRKSDLVGRVVLDNETMAVQLLTPDSQPLMTQQLSAGERQLLAVAMLWGLARASGRPVPVVIDTPLGRLDGEHRRSLVERYFPDASHQVILLSTDQEVDADFSNLLEDSVAHRYLIGYDEVRQSSSFSSGYFGQ
jgi:DNA sulfur modification protein DndD